MATKKLKKYRLFISYKSKSFSTRVVRARTAKAAKRVGKKKIAKDHKIQLVKLIK